MRNTCQSKGWVLGAMLAIVSPVWASTMSAADIAQRIKPVGEVYLDGEFGEVAAAESTEPKAPRNGQTVYQFYCTACHDTGAAGAPKKGDATAWKPRLDKDPKTLFEHVWNGYNAMPARGTCNDCSEEEIQAAIAYLIE